MTADDVMEQGERILIFKDKKGESSGTVLSHMSYCEEEDHGEP
jgi:hypothetical protein